MKFIPIAILSIFLLGVPALAVDPLHTLEQELQALERELPGILKEDTNLETRQDYVNRVLELRAHIEALGGKEEELTDGNQRVPILKSVMLKYRTKGSGLADFQDDKNYNTDGFASEGRDDNWVRSLKVEEYPRQIVIGEPFTFKAMAAQNAGTSKIAVRIDRRHSASSFGPAQINIKAAGSRSASSRKPPPPMKLNAVFSFKEDTWKSGAQYGLYDLEVRADGPFENTNDHDHYPNAKELFLTKRMSVNTAPSSKGAVLTFRFWVPARPDTKEEEKYLEFAYYYGNTDDEPVRVAAFPVPDLSETIETAEEDGPSSSSDKTADKDGDKDQNQSETSEQGTVALHPANPDVARLIEEWLAKAEPPQNATEAGDFQYNEWGQLVGTAADGGVAAPNSRPDAAIGRMAIEHVWAERDRLDSVDHCTLGEFVLGRLAGESLEICRNRYRPTMPNLVGTPAARAKSRAEKLGIEVTWQEGSVPDHPAQAETVEKQHPTPGTTLKPDQPVELWVFRQAVTMVTVPDVLGMTYRDAVGKLKQAGLQATIGKTSAPLTLAPNQKVQNQETAPGTKIPKEDKVVLNFAKEDYTAKLPPGALSGLSPSKGRLPGILSPDSPGKDRLKKVRMPDVIGMSYAKAAGKLQSVGLIPSRQPGSPAPRRTLANTVQKAEYPAKRLVDAGSLVNLTVYGPHPGKKEPETIVKRDPASAFGGRPPGKEAFNCETGIPGLILQTTGRMYPDRKNGELKTDAHGEKNYICRYQIKGKQRIALISFFDTPPTTTQGKKLKQQMCSVFGLMKNGKNRAVYLTLQNVSLSQSVGKENVMRFYDFHLNQITPHAISCSGKDKVIRKTPERASSPSRSKNNRSGMDTTTAGSCSQLPPAPSHMRNPTCQCSEANALFGTTTYTNCFWADKK